MAVLPLRGNKIQKKICVKTKLMKPSEKIVFQNSFTNEENRQGKKQKRKT